MPSFSHTESHAAMDQADVQHLLTQVPAMLVEVDSRGTIQQLQGGGLAQFPPQLPQVVGAPLAQLLPFLPGFRTDINPSEGLQHQSGLLLNGLPWQMVILTRGDSGWLGFLWLSQGESTSQAQLPLLAYFIQHAPAAIAMFDRDMRYLMVSDRWMEIYRLQGPILGRNHYEVFPEIPERWRRVHRRCMSGVIERCEADPFVRRDGKTEYINWVVAPWYQPNGEVGGLIFYTENVNEQVEARQRLVQLNQELKRSNERLTDFAAAVSHTIREPLALAIAQGKALITELEQTKESHLTHRANGWLNHLHRMEGIIAGLLTHAHLDELPADHLISLDRVMAETLTNLTPLISQRRAQVHVGSLPDIRANEFEMMALFQQLLVNAISYNEGETPEVILSAERQEDIWLFRIQDNGVGLDADQKAALFSFARERDTNMPRGHGVGLPVCQRIVSRMGGNIWVESEPGIGTTFFFSLPAAS